MTENRSRIRKLALAYEELTADERAEVDAHLERDPTLREELSRLRELEQLAQDPLGMGRSTAQAPAAPGMQARWPDPAASSDEESSQERESLRRLLRRATTDTAETRTRGTKAPRRGWRGVLGAPRLRRWVPVAAAAVLVFLFVGPWGTWRGGQDLGLSDLRLVAVDDRGQVQRSVPSTFSDGDAFALRFTVEADASIVVYHVDPNGEIHLAHPEKPSEPLLRASAGEMVQIPSSDAAQGWVFSGAPGIETFLVAATTEVDLDLVALDARIQRELASVRDRRARQLQLERLLRAHVGTASVVEAQHVR